MKLYDHLLQLRDKLARENKVRSFMVFTNEVVKEIAQRRPRTMGDFQNIHGVNKSGYGQIKAEKYGEVFIKHINGFLEKESQKFQEVNEIQELGETEYAILKALYSDARSVKELTVQFEIENSIIKTILRFLNRHRFIACHRVSVRNGDLFFSTKEGQKYIDNMPSPGTE